MASKINRKQAAQQDALARRQMLALFREGRLPEALQTVERLLAPVSSYRREHAELLNFAGVVARRLGHASLAERYWRQAMAANPADAHAYFNIGFLLSALGRVAEAEPTYRKALELMPGHPEAAAACNNLANAMRAAGSGEGAEASYRQAIALKPDFYSSWLGLGSLLRERGALDEAETACRRATELAPQEADAWLVLGKVLQGLERPVEAMAALGQASALKPDDANMLVEWLILRRTLCDWEGVEAAEARLRAQPEMLAQGIPVQPFTLLALNPVDAATHLAASRRHAEAIHAVELKAAPLAALKPVPHARLKIGYLSGDFHSHATSYLLAGVIEHHDASRFDISLYSYGPDVDSADRKRLQAACPQFFSLPRQTDAEIAARIAADAVDILVDLKGYTLEGRSGITARRPAPVIVNWLGYPGSLGHPRLADYFIGDPVASPLAHAAHFSEQLLLMPQCYQPTDNRRVVGPKPERVQAGLPEDAFVFCNFNQSYKTTPAMFRLWCRLLAEVPGSVLWQLQPKYAVAMENLRREAAREGIDPARLVFAPPLPQAEHLGRLQLANLALDPWPCVSHTTASDALWVGVPLIARIGEHFVSRVSASVLTAAGLPELVAQDEHAYFAMAKQLAQDPARLQALRNQLIEGRKASALFDTAGFTKALEQLYGRIGERASHGGLDGV